MKYLNEATGARRLVGLCGLLWLGLAAGGGWLVGCSSSTDPGAGGGVEISFRPAAQGQQITLSQTLEFSVSAPDAKVVNVNWKRGDVVVGNGMVYTYVPTARGADTLRVQAAADDAARNYYWVVNVVSSGNSLPPPVREIRAGPGPAPGDVAVTWNQVGTSTYPLDEYLVAVSLAGPITVENWDQANLVRRVVHRVAQVGYQEILSAAGDGMVPGADVWIAVRVIDELGQMSPIDEIAITTVTTSWWLNGVVRDDRDQTPAGVIVSSVLPALSTNTDSQGIFRLGPFRNIDVVTVRTTPVYSPIDGWFGLQSAPLDSVSGRDLDLVLITRHVLDPDCGLHDGQFLSYLRFMAKTELTPGTPANSIQWRWDSFPLRAWVPDLVSPSGVDFGAAARFAMAFYDSVMGEPYFEPAPDSASAQVVFRFASDMPSVYGEVSLLAPRSPGVRIGDVKPEQMQVYIGSNILATRFVKEVTLHELGHVLGLLSHTNCAASGYLMVESAGGNLNYDDPIHLDEQRAIRTIRRLPQGTNMDRYFVVGP